MLEVFPELIQMISKHLDCEGIRKFASVNKLIREMTYSAVVVAQYQETRIFLKGLFQSFQEYALKDGHMYSNKMKCKVFKATIEDICSSVEMNDNLGFLMDKCLETEKCTQYVRLPNLLSTSMKHQLNDREKRVIALGIPIQKRVRCKFSIKKQKLGRFQSALCEDCKKYACILCEDISTCSTCATSKCSSCRDSETFFVRLNCHNCCIYVADRMAAQGCTHMPHCEICGLHCKKPPRVCESCGVSSCDSCIPLSSVCMQCGQYSLW
ncbi:hypothetical protein GUITHDRAFT_109274 [Guillardia theta CCMP2712]|uniref:Uncharacterized protein n=1 Tax=Guillardia theta (strain CCMP2712) TaxID=905079 RepID=L1J8L0_GUITC|nr:hypothetical protein GUITHDRAFT_109274 [Guillardia theta CCMP2712]EKX44851.1 hypothetical protein GUITHDRAFT_109274 [Guillardia theta CCMP2712]|eukprot:XP_005831831.1 hypothetical protein GUITHDRAFT_109274 [Guillardia theta CCMP2712]